MGNRPLIGQLMDTETVSHFRKYQPDELEEFTRIPQGVTMTRIPSFHSSTSQVDRSLGTIGAQTPKHSQGARAVDAEKEIAAPITASNPGASPTSGDIEPLNATQGFTQAAQLATADIAPSQLDLDVIAAEKKKRERQAKLQRVLRKLVMMNEGGG